MQNKDMQNRDMQNKKVLLEIKHLAKKYGDLAPLQDVNCTVESGEVISVIGPSGTGKSTFLRCINRLEIPDSGEVYFSGTLMSDNRKQLRETRRKSGDAGQSPAVSICYQGDEYDPLKDDDLLSVRILKGTTSKAEYAFVDGENRLYFLLPSKDTLVDTRRIM